MHLVNPLLLIVLALLCAVSARSLWILKQAAPFTSVGWAASLLYGFLSGYEVATLSKLSPYLPYGTLVLMVVAFVIAGVRDERQAAPWYWPNSLTKRRSE